MRTAEPTGGVDVGPLEDFAVGEGRAVVVDGQQVAVFRHRDGRLSALDAVCPTPAGRSPTGRWTTASSSAPCTSTSSS